MPTWKKNIFVRVVKSRMEKESRTEEDILTEYPALTDVEKQEVIDDINLL